MKKLCCLLLAVGINNTLAAQSVMIGGDVPKPYVLNAAVIKQMKRVNLNLKARDSKMHQFSGVLLADILIEADVSVGEGSIKRAATSYVVVNAMGKDKAIYTLPEFEPIFTSNTIILADEIDGKPFLANEGPFQVIVPGEKVYGRWVRQVKDIKLVTVKE